MIKKLLTFLLLTAALGTSAQFRRDTTLKDYQVFASIGFSVFGYNKDINSYFSIYLNEGAEFNLSKKCKYGFAIRPMDFNWTGINADSAALGGTYDRARYYSFSGDAQVFIRYILTRNQTYFNDYNTFVELGAGYHAPYYFALNKFKDGNKTTDYYPNVYKDFYAYTAFYFELPQKIPAGIRVEYHPLT